MRERRAVTAKGQSATLALSDAGALARRSSGATALERHRASVPDKYRKEVAAKAAAVQWRRDVISGARPAPLGVSTRDELDEFIGSQQQPPVTGRAIRLWDGSLTRGKGSIAALAPAVRRDKNTFPSFEAHPKAAGRALSLYLGKERVENFLHVAEIVASEWVELGCGGPCKLRSNKDDKTCRPPNRDTFRRFLMSQPKPLVTLAHHGKQAYLSKCAQPILRKRPAVMEWAISDHRRFDVLVRNTLFDQVKTEQLYRPWKTILYDWGSGKIVGFCFAPTPSSRTINSSNRMAFAQFGFWKNLYWDNGKDYAASRVLLEEITLSPELQAILQQQQIGVTSALPKRPRSKPIESYFTRWAHRFDPVWKPAYVGRTPDNCSEQCRDAQKHHADYLTGKRLDTPMPTDVEFFRAAIQFIEGYNNTPLESLSHRTPNELFDAAYPPSERPHPDDLEFRRALDVLFSERVDRTVLAGGCFDLDRMRYEPADEVSRLQLDPLLGRKVTILRDPYNLGEAIACEQESLLFLGELRVQQFVAQCPNGRITRDQIQAALRTQRKTQRAYAEWLGLLDALSTAHGWRSPRQKLLEHGRLAATGTDDAITSAAPGARPARVASAAPGRAVMPQLAPAFVSDAVDSFPDISHLELEE